MTEYQLEVALKEVADEARENSFEIQQELSAYERIEDVRIIQHANATVQAAAEALEHALTTRRRIHEQQDYADTLRETIDGLKERIEDYDMDEVIHLRDVEADHRHNNAIIRKLKDDVANLKVMRRIIEAPRD